jgi:hypothetical protein
MVQLFQKQPGAPVDAEISFTLLKQPQALRGKDNLLHLRLRQVARQGLGFNLIQIFLNQILLQERQLQILKPLFQPKDTRPPALFIKTIFQALNVKPILAFRGGICRPCSAQIGSMRFKPIVADADVCF